MELNRIQVVLDEKGKTQVWLAEKLGVRQATVNDFCRNKSQPSIKRLNEIAKILGVSTYVLIGDYAPINEELKE